MMILSNAHAGARMRCLSLFKISVMILDARIGPNLAGFSASVGRTSEVVPSFECETTRVSSEAMSRASRTTVGTSVAAYTDW